MLSVYARHSASCKYRDIHYRQCRCPKWVRGVLENAGAIRMSVHTRSWVKAERKAREMEQNTDGRITIELPSALFLTTNKGEG